MRSRRPSIRAGPVSCNPTGSGLSPLVSPAGKLSAGKPAREAGTVKRSSDDVWCDIAEWPNVSSYCSHEKNSFYLDGWTGRREKVVGRRSERHLVIAEIIILQNLHNFFLISKVLSDAVKRSTDDVRDDTS